MDTIRAVRRPPARRGALRRGVLAAALVAAVSLAASSGTGVRRTALPLGHTLESPEAVVAALLEALAAADADRLQQLALSEDEFKNVVWPDLPSSRPEVALPFHYAWGTLRQNSRASLAMTLRAHAGRQYSFERIERRGEVTRYPSFSVHRQVDVLVREGSSRQRQRLRLFGSLLERDGRWKIFSFVVD
jgi:hypothetical protein